MSKTLENALEAALLTASKEAVDLIGYYPSHFLDMLVQKGARQTSEELMTRPKITHGLTVLWEKRKLNLSIEAIVLENEYKELFSEEVLDVARKSLKKLEYDFQEYFSPQPDTTKWGYEELVAAVDAYFDMLRMEIDGKSYVKSSINEKLREGALVKRNRSSVETIMQNVSSVLQDLGVRWIDGYKPLSHVGAEVSDQIKKIIFEKGYLDEDLFQPTFLPDVLDKRTRKLRRSKILGNPKGIKKPRKKESTSITYERDSAVKGRVLDIADGYCEYCEQKGPFLTPDGDYFLEVHHVKYLADGGSDTVQNAVALCPNCHSAFHYSRDAEALANGLYTSTERLIRE